MPAITQCEMIVGFLVPHRCANKAVTQCVKCNRSFCDEHVEITGGGLVCLACQQGLTEPVAVAETARTFDAGDVLVFQNVGTFDSDADDTFSDLS